MNKDYSIKVIDSFVTASKIAKLKSDEKIILIGSVLEVVKKTKRDFMFDRIKNAVCKWRTKLL